jgi:hypothetical protein
MTTGGMAGRVEVDMAGYRREGGVVRIVWFREECRKEKEEEEPAQEVSGQTKPKSSRLNEESDQEKTSKVSNDPLLAAPHAAAALLLRHRYFSPIFSSHTVKTPCLNRL